MVEQLDHKVDGEPGLYKPDIDALYKADVFIHPAQHVGPHAAGLHIGGILPLLQHAGAIVDAPVLFRQLPAYGHLQLHPFHAHQHLGGGARHHDEHHPGPQQGDDSEHGRAGEERAQHLYDRSKGTLGAAGELLLCELKFGVVFRLVQKAVIRGHALPEDKLGDGEAELVLLDAQAKSQQRGHDADNELHQNEKAHIQDDAPHGIAPQQPVDGHLGGSHPHQGVYEGRKRLCDQ